MKTFTFSALFALGGVFITETSHGAAFQNGSFEQNGGNGSTTATGWTFTLGAGNAFFALNNFEGGTNGSFAAVFNPGGGANTGEILAQTFNTVFGTTYSVSFDFGEFSSAINENQLLQITVRDGSNNNLITSGSGTVLNGNGGNNSGVSITQNTNILKIADSTSSGGVFTTAAPNKQFSTVSFNFVANAASSTIAFTDIGANGTVANTDFILDNVKVGVVPEPSTWVSVVTGLGLLAGFRRKRTA